LPPSWKAVLAEIKELPHKKPIRSLVNNFQNRLDATVSNDIIKFAYIYKFYELETGLKKAKRGGFSKKAEMLKSIERCFREVI
jgi:hypothetical protein